MTPSERESEARRGGLMGFLIGMALTMMASGFIGIHVPIHPLIVIGIGLLSGGLFGGYIYRRDRLPPPPGQTE